jgi:hypothetical protein
MIRIPTEQALFACLVTEQIGATNTLALNVSQKCG